MNILFVTNNFPPVVDGVGDYTYKLSQALIKYGAEVSILCSNNPDIIKNKQVFKAEKIKVFPIIEAWDNQGVKAIENIFKNKKYDYISLQYVPFAFQKKGLPLHLSENLKKLFPTVNWHIMFHELWVGMEKGATIKSKLHGYMQKRLIHNMIKKLKPLLINTQCKLYKHQLGQLGYDTEILPLFSNILRDQTIPKPIEDEKEKKKMVLAIFGSIHFGAPVASFVGELLDLLESDTNQFANVKFVFIGNCGSFIEEWTSVLKKNDIEFEITGKLSEYNIGNYLRHVDFGITTTPYILVEKSGTVAAMLEHDLNVICVARPWNVSGYELDNFTSQIGVINYQYGILEKIINKTDSYKHTSVLHIGKEFMDKLKKIL